MESPQKGLVCNLNHVHLQHISLGLHLSRHPELQEEAPASGPKRGRTGCSDCHRHANGGVTPELVDANSNNPSLSCRCCAGHLLPTEVKPGLALRPEALANGPILTHEEEDGDLGSPSEPDSSSVSSCSDLSLDDTPVSVYYKAFPGEEAQSPENPPNIVPLEEAQNLVLQARPEEKSLNLNIWAADRPPSRVWDSPDSLGSASSLESTSGPASPSPQTLAERPLAGSNQSPPPAPSPPVRPCRAPPAVPVPPAAGPGLDSNCNALPDEGTEPEGSSVGRVDINSNREALPRPRFGGVPPPVPPRTKRGLQGLRRSEAGKPRSETAPLGASEEQPAGPQGEGVKKTITSFHELAQKRKKVATQGRKEQSDWLIVFSPDTEFPPSPEATWGSAPDKASPSTSPSDPANPTTACGVTTFKELRYRKQKSQLAPKVAARPLVLGDPGPAVPESEAEVPPNGPFRAPKEAPSRQKKTSRLGLQPIVEGGFEEGEEGGGGTEPRRSWEEMPKGKRDPWMPGKEERGSRGFAEVGPHPAHPPPPLLVRVSLVDGQGAEGRRHPLSDSPVLESVALTSPDRTGPAFCPRLKTLSCEEVCLLAGRPGHVLATLSPEEVLPIRLSPIGAFSPPARSVLPFLESSDLAVLFSPLFPRSRTYPALAFSPRQVPELLRAARGPLDSQAGAGPGRTTRAKMGDEPSEAPKPLRHSQSSGGISSDRRLRRADTDRPSSQLREQKKALLVAISASVDKIVAHFSTARNLVQKAQLGDSRISPDVGYLVLNTLCPALRALVSDGLKPFQKDVITGQRPSSPWSVVEASAKPGPHTRSLNALYWRVSRLAPLRSNQQRFHAFILGLLNLKQLEQWFSHLQRNSELISALYLPTAFLVLSQGFCRRWAEELLLLLQPLSMLTFQLDLLFEHHHLPLEVRPAPRPAVTPPTELATGFCPTQGPDSPQSLVSLSGPSTPMDESPTLPQRLLRWGDRLTHTWLGNEASLTPEPDPEAVQQETGGKPPNWWEQLSRASGVYATSSSTVSKPERFPYAHWAKLRTAVEGAVKEARAGIAESALSADTCPPSPGRDGRSEQPMRASGCKTESAPADETGGKADDTEVPTSGEPRENPDATETPGSGKGKRLGWLFGASGPGMPAEPDSNLPKSRRPSSWLPPAMNVLALVMRTGPKEKGLQEEESWQDDGSPAALQNYRAVRALCDHVGKGADHLSFRKGDVLQILETVSEDWIRCSHGDRRGLVPVGYTSLLV
uniref:AP-4 complex accessory subunit RUSC1 isoform X1 n=1 Tax=Pogona vitticeps TaxID=103695 RepID=A0ABM5F4R4_9SAUR